jgi:hypothetical protein
MITLHHIKIIENRLNNRPRKSLGYLTPNEYIRSFVAINSWIQQMIKVLSLKIYLVMANIILPLMPGIIVYILFRPA